LIAHTPEYALFTNLDFDIALRLLNDQILFLFQALAGSLASHEQFADRILLIIGTFLSNKYSNQETKILIYLWLQ